MCYYPMKLFKKLLYFQLKIKNFLIFEICGEYAYLLFNTIIATEHQANKNN